MALRKLSSLLLLGSTLGTAAAKASTHAEKISPKVFIISMVWKPG